MSSDPLAAALGHAESFAAAYTVPRFTGVPSEVAAAAHSALWDAGLVRTATVLALGEPSAVEAAARYVGCGLAVRLDLATGGHGAGRVALLALEWQNDVRLVRDETPEDEEARRLLFGLLAWAYWAQVPAGQLVGEALDRHAELTEARSLMSATC